MRNTSSTAGTANIKCPFFIAHGQTEIVCESIVPGGKCCATRFANRQEKKLQQETFCSDCYKRCEIYISIRHWVWPDDDP